MTASARRLEPVVTRKKLRTRKILFINFVDAIFTTLLERPFTKVFDRLAQTLAIACLYPGRITG
jgi:hypothetical protein